MENLLLDDLWRLHYAPEHAGGATAENVKEHPAYTHIRAAVPGNVELSLHEAGKAPDPFFGANLYEYRPYEFYEWWYTRDFDAPPELLQKGAELCLDGVDTFGEIYVNGELAGETGDMMLEYRFDITRFLRPGPNEIAVKLRSAVNEARKKDYPVAVIGAERADEMVYVRKPGHMYGWDIAPRFVSAGLWRSVYIRPKRTEYWKEVYMTTLSADRTLARVLLKFRFATDDPMLEGFAVRVRGQCGDSVFDETRPVKFCSDGMTFQVEDPKLWWPKDYGDAALYDTRVELLHHGETVDTWALSLGIRVFEVRTNFVPGDDGEFKILANGVPILCKGANWVPLDAFHSRDAGRYEQALALFRETGCNIVRCWGGNVYEDHAFFDICDRSGIMVWQDFSMACAVYPQTDEFARVIEKEAAAVVKKLRNHPSLLLWSGDNEVDAVYESLGYRLPHVRNNRLTREVLPRVTAAHDPFRFFLPSSPYIPLNISGDLNVPEQHNWGPRDYFKGDFYRHSSAHFISEIGYHGCPAVSSLKKFIPEQDLWPIKNDSWDAHNTEYAKYVIKDRGYDRNQLMVDQVRDMFGVECRSLPQLAMLSQISQAEAKKFFIELTRLKKWRRTGIIWWNMLDCWPQISDAVVDYYFHKKLAFYYITRVQKPVCMICAEPENWRHGIWLCNDSNESHTVGYTVRDGETGETLLSGRTFSPANENVQAGQFKAFSGVQRLIVMEWTLENGEKGANHYITGYPAFDPERYAKWLKTIEKLETPFDSAQCFA